MDRPSERTDEWRKEQDKILGPSQAAQECDTDFLSSGQSVVDPQILQWYKDELTEAPIEELGMDRGFWVFRQPDYTKEYIVVGMWLVVMERISQLAKCLKLKIWNKLRNIKDN